MSLTAFDFQAVGPFGYPSPHDTKSVGGNDVTITRPEGGSYGTYRCEFAVHLPGPGILTGTNKTMEDWVAFVRSIQGGYAPFLWKDPFVALLKSVATTDTDGQIGTGDGSTDTFSLAHRDIDASTLRVFVNAVEQLSGWALTGNNAGAGDAAPLIDFTSPPTNTHPVTVSYEFYHRVRFDPDPDIGDWRGANVDFLTPRLGVVEDWEGAHRA